MTTIRAAVRAAVADDDRGRARPSAVSALLAVAAAGTAVRASAADGGAGRACPAAIRALRAAVAAGTAVQASAAGDGAGRVRPAAPRALRAALAAARTALRAPAVDGGASHPHPAVPRVLLAGFGGVAAAHLGALLAGAPVAQVTKPALMPLLGAYALARGGPRLLVGALLFGCGGDVLLQLGGRLPFLLGMGSFAAGHGCYLALFARHGADSRARGRGYVLAAGYGAAWLGTVTLLWPGLEDGLRVPVGLYSLLLTATALAATRAGARTAAGGLAFLLSDTLIASGLAGWPQPPAPQFWIMLTYLVAQFLLADGLLRRVPAQPQVTR
ncbi:lysoplasmalogenase [Streptomyces gamaensis]|uniref:Lysoplasmalogenase n=1 Tax=Streptomyces gamaensis TaxID=1763542 RepID=A0ABW0Z1X9_9ACTN